MDALVKRSERSKEHHEVSKTAIFFLLESSIPESPLYESSLSASTNVNVRYKLVKGYNMNMKYLFLITSIDFIISFTNCSSITIFICFSNDLVRLNVLN